ncbi:pentapeptide repeat-containing protein [Nonomuraea sp. NPDC001684]
MSCIVFLVLLLGPIAQWATPATGMRGKELADTINATRQILLAAVGGIGLLIGAAFTARTYYLAQRGQLTDRYTKAIGLLGSDRLTERIGGVYALEHLMIESEREHETVVEVLAAFVRDQTAFSPVSSAPQEPQEPQEDERAATWLVKPRTDVQAALTVLGRRPKRPERDGLVDLSQTDLTGADLGDLTFDGAWFWRSKLRSAKLQGASFEGTVFSHADLKYAGLSYASLRGAKFYNTQLQQAVILSAKLQGAVLEDADLRGAYLAATDLHEAVLKGAQMQGTDFIAFPTGQPAEPTRRLTVEQLAEAEIDDSTRLPEQLHEALQDVMCQRPGTHAGPTSSTDGTGNTPAKRVGGLAREGDEPSKGAN